jgi:hypothetical protein
VSRRTTLKYHHSYYRRGSSKCGQRSYLFHHVYILLSCVGCAFVTYASSSPEVVEAAIDALHDKKIVGNVRHSEYFYLFGPFCPRRVQLCIV